MTIDPTRSTTPPATAPQPASAQAKSLGQDAFMRLLVAQLKNQDPTQPQDGSAFVAQLAQFTTLEKLTSMSQALTALTSIDASLVKITQLLSPLDGLATAANQESSTTKS